MKNKKVIVVTLIFIVGIIAASSWLLLKSRKVTAQELYDLAQLNMSQGRVLEAKKLLYKAEEKSVADADLVWSIANYEAETGNSAQAQRYALKAWEMGKHDKECFLALIHNSGLASVELQVEYGRRLLQKLAEGSLKVELEADLHFALKEYEQALNLYQELYLNKPEKYMAVKVAFIFSTMDKIEEAVTFLEQAEEQSGLDSKGYSLLATFKLYLKKIDELDRVFKKAVATGINDPDFLYKQAFIYTVLNQQDKACEVFEKQLKAQKPDEKTVNSRLLYAYNSHALAKLAPVKELLEKVRPVDSPVAEGERKFYEALLALVPNKQPAQEDLLKVRQWLTKAKRLLSEDLIVGVVDARVATMSGRYEEALDFYKSNSEPLSKKWRRIILDEVYALQGNGDLQEAIKVLEEFHKDSAQVSFESLSLLRDLYESDRSFKRSLHVHSILEKHFSKDFNLRLIRARLLMKSGQAKQAMEFLEKILTTAPATHRLAVEEALAGAYLQSGMVEKALKIAEGKASLILFKAQALTALNRNTEAEVIYRRVYSELKSSSATKQLVFFLISSEKIAEAESLMQEASAVPENSGWIALAQATLALGKNDLVKAEAALESAKLDKEVSGETLYLESELFFRKGQIYQALDNLNDLSLYTPNDARVFHLKARSNLQLGKVEDALKDIQKALVLNGQSSLIHLTHSRVLLELKMSEEAQKVAMPLMKNENLRVPALQVILGSLMQLKEYPKALLLIDETKGLNDIDKLSMKADLYVAQGKIDLALQQLQKIADQPGVRFKILMIKAKTKRDLGAFQNHKLTFNNWLELAGVLLGNDDYESAALCFEQALKIDPGHAVLLNNFAWCLYKTGDSTRAEEISRKAYSLASRNNEIVHTLARILIQNQKFSDAENLLSPVIASGDTDARHHFSLGEVYENLKNSQEALYHYRQAILKSSKGSWNLPLSESELTQKIKSLE